jgi:hypothetical protein
LADIGGRKRIASSPSFLKLFIAASGMRAYGAAASDCGLFPWLPYSRAIEH